MADADARREIDEDAAAERDAEEQAAANATYPRDAKRVGAWKLCKRYSTLTDDIISGDSGMVDVYAYKGQQCSTAVRSYRWLRVDRGGLKGGWTMPARVRYQDY